ncbi:hypothetical protein P7C70_g6498, partial [Phenoliferia sp. Uapishka_3]
MDSTSFYEARDDGLRTDRDEPVTRTLNSEQSQDQHSAVPEQSNRHLPATRLSSTTTRSLLSENGERNYGGSGSGGRPSIPRVKILTFNGDYVSQFLQKYEMEFKSRGHGGEGMAENLPLYVKKSYFKMVRDMPGWEERDWNLLKQSMRDTFVDEELFKYSLADLRRFVSKTKKRGKPDKLSKISKAYFKFAEISSYLKKKGTISEQEESRYFLSILPADIVDMIYARRDTRELVRTKGELCDDDQGGALPEIKEIVKELRAIFASFAKRGKMSKIRTRRQWESSESESDRSDDSNESSDSSDEEEERTHRSKTTRSSRSDSKSGKSSKWSDTERGNERMKDSVGRKNADNTSELGMKDLLAKFNQLQVTMAQLATNQAQAVAGGFGGASYAPRRTSFSGIPRPQTPTFQNASTTRWPARPKDAPPHEANNAAYESNFVGSGTNAIPVNNAPVNQWGTRPQTVPVNTPYAPRPPPICLWCAGEDGEPHWMSACHDLQSALASGVIRKDNEGKTRYGARYVPSRAHPRGMRAWVKEQEILAKPPVAPTVRFDVATNSVEYDPPQVSEGDGEYETANVRVDEYEVNQTKRTRSASPDSSHPRKSSPRNFKPRVNDFEDLGVPKGGSVMREDEIMGEVPKKRQTRPKLESAMESRSDPRDFLDQILKQPITIPMNVMLANSPELAKLMVSECRRKRTPLGEQEVNHLKWSDDNEIKVNAHSLKGGNKKSYYAGVLAFANIAVEGETIKALLDNGSMICMMQDQVRRRLGLPIRTDGQHRVRMAGGASEVLLGISENVPVRIGGVTTHVHFFIPRNCTNQILLGQNFLRQVEARFNYNSDGSVMMGMTHKGRKITVEVTGRDESRYLSHVPGEAREYDTAMVSLMDVEGGFRQMNTLEKTANVPICFMCERKGRHCDDNLHKRTACTARRSVLKSVDSPPVYIKEIRINKEGRKVPIFSGGDSSREVDTSEEDGRSPRRSNKAAYEEGIPGKVGKGKWGRLAKKNERPQKTHKLDFFSEKERRRNRGPSRGQITAEENEFRYHQSELKEVGRKAYTPEDDDNLMVGGRPSPAFKDLLARADRIEAAERAIMNKRKSEEELEKIFPRRTAPWIASCTADEARERAQLLRDEYDKFLAVLFGRKIPISRPSLEQRGYYSQESYSRRATDELVNPLFGMGPRLQSQDESDVPAEVSPLQILVDSGVKRERAPNFLGGENIECEEYGEGGAEPLGMKNEDLEKLESVTETTSLTLPLGKGELTKEPHRERQKVPEEGGASCTTTKPFNVEDWLAQDDDLYGTREEIEDSRVAWREYCANAEEERRKASANHDSLDPREFAFRATNQSEDLLVRELGLKLETTELTSNLVEWVNDSDSSEGEGELLETSQLLDEENLGSSYQLTSNMVQLRAWGVRKSDGSSILRTRREFETAESESGEDSDDQIPLDHEWESEDSMPSLGSASEDESEQSNGRTMPEISTFERNVREMESWCESDSEFEWVSGSEEEVESEEEQDTSWRDSRNRLMKMMNEATYQMNNAELEPSDSDATSASDSWGKAQPLAKTSARERMYLKSPIRE